MTLGGEIMLRVRDRVVVGQISAERWRISRANGLARIMAFRRMTRNPVGREHLKRIVIEDIVPDCGWPRLSWLKRRVREEATEIESLRAERAARNPTGEDVDG